MKNKTLITIILVIILLAIIIVCYKVFNKPKQINSIESLKLYYSTGPAIDASVSYELTCEESCYVIIKPEGETEESQVKYDVSDDQIKEIIKVLNDYKVSTWDGYDKANKRVLDGGGFTFILKTKEGSSVYATGYMKYPSNYKEVRDKITSILDKSKEL